MTRELKATQQKTIDVAHAFAEQRDYTTLCFEKLRRDIKQTEGRVTRRLDRHEVMLSEILSEVKAIRPRG